EEFTGQMRISTMNADGTERTVELTPAQITVGGNVIFTSFLRDLTEIERSHAALADQTERLDRLIAAAIPGILISDEHGRITHINRSFGTIFGLDEPEQLVGTLASSVVSRIGTQFGDSGEFARRSAEVLRARQPIFPGTPPPPTTRTGQNSATAHSAGPCGGPGTCENARPPNNDATRCSPPSARA